MAGAGAHATALSPRRRWALMRMRKRRLEMLMMIIDIADDICFINDIRDARASRSKFRRHFTHAIEQLQHEKVPPLMQVSSLICTALRRAAGFIDAVLAVNELLYLR